MHYAFAQMHSIRPHHDQFFSIKTLDVFEIYRVKMCIIMHRSFLDTLPEYLMNMFLLNVHVYNYNTRHDQLFHQ